MSNTKKLKTKEKKMAYDWYIAKSVVRAKGFSYGQLAEKLGVSVTTIHDICNFPPNVVRVKQLADAIGCTFFDLFDFSADSATAYASPASSPSGLTCPHCGQPLFLTATPE